MTKKITKHAGLWKPGQSGNPRGRPPKGRALAEMLSATMEENVIVGSEQLSAKEALARLVREFSIHGEVWLNNRRLAADTVFEWLAVVKWLYEHVDGKAPDIRPEETEMIIQVIRDDLDD